MIAASVNTRVVSWKLAAEMNESVDSDAFVIPSNTALPAGFPPASSTRAFSFELETIHHFLRQEFGIANVFNTDPAQHLARDHFQMLIVDVHALQPVNFLNFVYQVLLQFALAQYGENIMRIARNSSLVNQATNSSQIRFEFRDF